MTHNTLYTIWWLIVCRSSNCLCTTTLWGKHGTPINEHFSNMSLEQWTLKDILAKSCWVVVVSEKIWLLIPNFLLNLFSVQSNISSMYQIQVRYIITKCSIFSDLLAKHFASKIGPALWKRSRYQIRPLVHYLHPTPFLFAASWISYELE